MVNGFAVDRVLFVHGYSETSLGAYASFPRVLQAATGIPVDDIVLSAFNSLDDQVSIDDLAAALEDHVGALEANQQWKTETSAIIAHSTGALVARRWMLNRRQSNSSSRIPSHLVTMAGANHGSSLAQLGKSILGYVQQAANKHVDSVGARVLTDLDYGSDFLLKLNRQWVDATNSGLLRSLYAFSMGGDIIGKGNDLFNLFSQLSEPGSDNTVRVSGANLNCRFLVADPTTGTIEVDVPAAPVAHLVLHGYSHFGTVDGILGSVTSPSDPPMVAVLQALRVADDAAYAARVADWQARTDAWTKSNPKNANATAVFSLFDRSGTPIPDCFIGFMDRQKVAAGQTEALTASSAAIIDKPIHNDVQRASYAFYINWELYKDIDHLIHIEAHSGSPLVRYAVLDYAPTPAIGKLVEPNQFTYVRVQLNRNTDDVYQLYHWIPDDDLNKYFWPPWPDRNVIPLIGPDVPAAPDQTWAQPSGAGPGTPPPSGWKQRIGAAIVWVKSRFGK
jgi:hypothetical protein